jgi:nucleoside-diphosphate-sugar epimerase
MKVVIIGGGGNIGLAGVVPALQSFGYEVTLITRSKRQVPGARCLVADYREPGFAEAVRQEHFDAAISMITYDKQEAEILLRCGLKQIVFISTVCVMGGPLAELPASEITAPAPLTKYGINKLEAEWALLSQTEVPVTIFRPASTAGPQFPILRQLAVEPDSRWVSRLQKGLPVVVADHGLQRWSWCSADDAGRAIAACLGRQRCYHQVYILTRPDPIRWIDYHERVASILRVRHNWAFIPSDAIIASGLECGLLKEQSRWDQIYDVSKLLRDIPEFSPTTSLEAMIERCFYYLQHNPITPNQNLDERENQLVASWERRAAIVQQSPVYPLSGAAVARHSVSTDRQS